VCASTAACRPLEELRPSHTTPITFIEPAINRSLTSMHVITMRSPTVPHACRPLIPSRAWMIVSLKPPFIIACHPFVVQGHTHACPLLKRARCCHAACCHTPGRTTMLPANHAERPCVPIILPILCKTLHPAQQELGYVMCIICLDRISDDVCIHAVLRCKTPVSIYRMCRPHHAMWPSVHSTY
jgi:hypothetical protein